MGRRKRNARRPPPEHSTQQSPPERNTQQSAKDQIFKGASPETDVLIAVMGQTGAGKSFFINAVLGRESVEVGDGLHSCTAHLQAVVAPPGHAVYQHFPSWPTNKRLVLVDTPGFDDSDLSDVEILTRLGDWLAASYIQKMELAGIIYLHDIGQRRMGGSASKNLEVFQKLCGKNAFPSIVLGTTQWVTINDKFINMAYVRESELRARCWLNMLLGGSTMRRVEDQNPWLMIGAVYPRPDYTEVALRIQVELVNLKKIIPQTEAAAYLREGLQQCCSSMKKADPLNPEVILLEKQIKLLKLSLGQRLREFLGL